MNINVNQEIIIYPTEQGWKEIHRLLENKFLFYGMLEIDVQEYINKHTYNNGYKDQLWQIMYDFGKLFFNGSDFVTAKITFIE